MGSCISGMNFGRHLHLQCTSFLLTLNPFHRTCNVIQEALILYSAVKAGNSPQRPANVPILMLYGPSLQEGTTVEVMAEVFVATVILRLLNPLYLYVVLLKISFSSQLYSSCPYGWPSGPAIKQWQSFFKLFETTWMSLRLSEPDAIEKRTAFEFAFYFPLVNLRSFRFTRTGVHYLRCLVARCAL